MNKILLGFRGKVLGAAMLLAALVLPYNVTAQTLLKDQAYCLFLMEKLLEKTPDNAKPFAEGYLLGQLLNHRLEDGYEALGDEATTAQTVAATEANIQMGIAWFDLFICTRQLDADGFFQPMAKRPGN